MFNRMLAGSNLVLGGALALLMLTGASPDKNASFDTVDVRRINVVDAEGETRVAIAGTGRLPDGVVDGVVAPAESIPGRSASSGMIFFNNAGDEVGGYIYSGAEVNGTGRQLGHISMDGWKDNMVVALQHNDNGRTKYAGLRVLDRPSDGTFAREWKLNNAYMAAETDEERERIMKERRALDEDGGRGAERMFVGSRDDVAMLELKDSKGRVRMRLQIGEDETPRIEFLDAEGNVTKVITETA